MDDHTSVAIIPQPPVDDIDFPVSDLFRDHYAAQGLTHPSGRHADRSSFIPSVKPAVHEDILESRQHAPLAQAITELTAELRFWRRDGRQPGIAEQISGKSDFPIVCRIP